MNVVRYEGFLANPERIVREMCEFAQLEFHPDQAPAAGQRRPRGSLDDADWYPLLRDENERYLRDIDPALVTAIHARGADLVERLGHELLPG